MGRPVVETYDVFKRIDGEYWTYGTATARSLPAMVEMCARAYPGEPILTVNARTGARVLLDAPGMLRVARLVARVHADPSPLDRAAEQAA